VLFLVRLSSGPAFEPGFAIIRIDLDVRNDEDRITVKSVVRTLEVAISEVERLNRVNADKSCLYFWQYTRIEPS
jgi:hypothetical protein